MANSKMTTMRLTGWVTPVALLVLFAGSLLGVDRLAFRDVGHFYGPLYDYVGSRCPSFLDGFSGGRSFLPFWNPLDQTGMSLVGETTTAVFYPVRVFLFALPISSDTALAWYVVLHLILASITAATAARWANVGRGYHWVAAAIYPLSGGVFFLYTNPPFLVSAAWLPLAIGALIAVRPIKPTKQIAVAGFAMAMMILAGDPQTALHTVLIAMFATAAITLRRAWSDRSTSQRSRKSQSIKTPLTQTLFDAAGSLTVVIGASTVAACCAAPQIAASLDWALQSDRISDSTDENWLLAPENRSRRQTAYQFSVPPWHLTELATPNASGTLLPLNRRWTNIFHGDQRTWTPTIYASGVGFLAILLESLSLLLRRRATGVFGRRREARWTLIGITSVTLICGQFGVVYFVQSACGAWLQHDSAIGGPYWVLYEFLPGYDSFRYPAKWLPFLSLSVSILAASWVGQLRTHLLSQLVRKRIRALAIGCACVLMFMILLSIAARSLIGSAQVCSTVDLPLIGKTDLPADEFWGPLDLDGGVYDFQWSLLHTTAVSCVLLALAMSARWLSRNRYQQLIVLVIAIDGTVAAFGILHTVDRQVESDLIAEAARRGGSAIATLDDDHQASTARTPRFLRTQIDGGWPGQWRTTRSETRMQEVETGTRIAWLARWHLVDHAAVFNSMVTMRPSAIDRFWESEARFNRGRSRAGRQAFWRNCKPWLGVSGESQTTANSKLVDVDSERYRIVDLSRVIDQSPANTFSPHWRLHAKWDSVQGEIDPAVYDQLLDRVSTQGVLADPILQIDALFDSVAEPGCESLPTDDLIRSVEHLPESELVRVQCSGRRLLTARTYQDGNWVAEYRRDLPAKPGSVGAEPAKEWTPVKVHRVDGLAQGVLLPAGQWTVRFRYQPWWIWPSIAVACVGFSILACLPFVSRAARGRAPCDVRIDAMNDVA